MSDLDNILAEIQSSSTSRAQRRQWNPSQTGVIDIRIAADGEWYHQGRKFRRASMVRLFANILRRERGQYFLVTPVEKLRIQVDDAPFVAVLVERVETHDQTAILFTTNLGERVIVDATHRIRVRQNPLNDQPRPYLQLGDGLEALIGRSAFYDLIGYAETRSRNGSNLLVVSSMGHEFDLGSTDE